MSDVKAVVESVNEHKSLKFYLRKVFEQIIGLGQRLVRSHTIFNFFAS